MLCSVRSLVLVQLNSNSRVFLLPVGVICAAPAVEGAWWRAQVITFYKETDEVEIRYVDYGGYDRVKIDSLRQIR